MKKITFFIALVFAILQIQTQTTFNKAGTFAYSDMVTLASGVDLNGDMYPDVGTQYFTEKKVAVFSIIKEY